jgi:hypothetical protein
MMGRSTARGRVWITRRTVYASVTDSRGVVVWTDNTGVKAHGKMLRSCLGMVESLRTVENVGHRLSKSYGELVDDARHEL